jgi:exodeoxyribonuclease VII large subunit
MPGFFDVHEKLNTPQRDLPKDPATLTVSQLTAQIDKVLKTNLPAAVLVRGELSNINLHRTSGHLYFTLKDSAACLDCVMFKDNVARLKFKPVDGMEMLAAGRIGVYAQRGKYQLYANNLTPLGQGALELAFQQLKSKLEREGLFDPLRKRPIPSYPLNIALLTSRATAALQDMLKVLRRFAHLKICIYHVPVQGDGSAEKIAAAIDHLSSSTYPCDVILLARGGGSLEDLWEFNEEIVARAIVASRIPVITGIGHEVDVSIADLVADYHAHTPTEAARVATAFWKDAVDTIESHAIRLRRAARTSVADARQQIISIERHELFRRPMDMVDTRRQRLDDLQRSLRIATSERIRLLQRQIASFGARLELHQPTRVLSRKRDAVRTIEQRLSVAFSARLRRETDRVYQFDCRLQDKHPRHVVRLAQQRVMSLESLLNAYNPINVLRRGYSITTLQKTGQVIRSAKNVEGGEVILTRLPDGTIESVIEHPLFRSPPPPG